MKKIIVLTLWLLVGVFVAAQAQQTGSSSRKEDRKAQREAEKARIKAEEELAYKVAVQAINDRQFVLEVDQVMFKRGRNVFVTSNTNFVMLNDKRASVQVAFNTPNPGPNGIGGITVDGNTGDVKVTTDKRGNVNCSFSVQGVGISAQVFITLTNGSSKASARISPNYNSNTLNLSGAILPLSDSNVFKGRSF